MVCGTPSREMLKARHRHREFQQIALPGVRIHVHDTSGSLNGRPRKKRSLIRLKIAVFSPIPRASVSNGSKVNPGDLSNCRRAKRRSVFTIGSLAYRLGNDNHSYRNATIGSTWVARRAGTK